MKPEKLKNPVQSKIITVLDSSTSQTKAKILHQLIITSEQAKILTRKIYKFVKETELSAENKKFDAKNFPKFPKNLKSSNLPTSKYESQLNISEFVKILKSMQLKYLGDLILSNSEQLGVNLRDAVICFEFDVDELGLSLMASDEMSLDFDVGLKESDSDDSEMENEYVLYEFEVEITEPLRMKGVDEHDPSKFYSPRKPSLVYEALHSGI